MQSRACMMNSKLSSRCSSRSPFRGGSVQTPVARRRIAAATRAASRGAAATAPSSGSPKWACDDEAAALDVGNIIAFEHVNVQVPDLEAARLFYGEGLGLTQDPDTTGPERGGLDVVWYNAGRSHQIHVCRGAEPQGLPPGGAVKLVVPSVERAADRLEHVAARMGDVAVAHLGHGRLEARDPWGNAFVLEEEEGQGDRGAGSSTAVRIAEVLLPCHQGTAAAIGDFYEQVLRARVVRGGSGGSGSSRVEVVAGPGTRLAYVESAALGARTDAGVAEAYSGWHVCIYLANYGPAFRSIEALKLIDNDHPFRDKVERGIRDALRNRQFRFREIVGLEGGTGEGSGVPKGGLAFRLSHEVRSVHHPQFMRPRHVRPAW